MAGALVRFSLRLPSSRASLLHHRSPFSSCAARGYGNPVPSKPLHHHRHPLNKEPLDGASRHPRFGGFKVHAAAAEKEGPKWWEKTAAENMTDVHSTEEFLSVLSQAGEKLVIVEFYATWCASCRALFPRLCRTALENLDVIFVKVNFDENKPMCRRLNVKVLPYFHFYRGADGLLDAFSCSLAKFQKIKDAIAVHNTARCSIGPPSGVGDLDLVGEHSSSPQKDQPAKGGTR